MTKTQKLERCQQQSEPVGQTNPKCDWVACGLLLLCLVTTIFMFSSSETSARAPMLLINLPIVIAAMYYGARPAMLLTVIGGLAVAYILGVRWGVASNATQQSQIGVFLSIGMTISWFGGKLKNSQKQLANLAINTDQRKDDFLAMLGHELRNPLSGITSAARVLINPALNQRGLTENANIIQRQAAHMTNLISDLLDVSRVTRGQIEIERAPVDLVKVMHAAVEQVTALIEHREHRLVLNLPAAPVFVLGDKTRLVQVVTNLLVNAARYTPHKGVLTLTLSESDDHAQLSVQDNGIGITQEMVANVFDIFVQAKRSTDGVMGGLGLGLTLVKSMVEAHGGEAHVYSAGVNQGSTFSVTLPLFTSTQENMKTVSLPLVQPKPTVEVSEVVEAKSLDILLVDDNQDASQPLAMLLEFEGHRVVVAHNGTEALKQAEQERFDVAILDIGLPDTDGYTLARKFRAIPHQSAARLVAVTGYGTAQDIARAHDAGFDQHIVKPIDIDLVLKELEQVPRGGVTAFTASPLTSAS